jgi:hypothetical protein
MTEAEETVGDLNVKMFDTAFLSLQAEAKTAVDINISAEHNRLQNPCQGQDTLK